MEPKLLLNLTKKKNNYSFMFSSIHCFYTSDSQYFDIRKVFAKTPFLSLKHTCGNHI